MQGSKGGANGELTNGGVSALAALVVSPSAYPGATLGKSYSVAFKATGGTAPLHWVAFGLPVGLAINGTTGVISGKPTVAGKVAVLVEVTDSTARPMPRLAGLGGSITVAK